MWALDEGAGARALERVEAFVAKIGARPVHLDAERHDRLVAMVSHLRGRLDRAHGVAATEEAGEPELLLLAAGGFRDLTRLAASSAPVERHPRRERRRDRRAISLYVERLTRLREMVEAGDAGEVERAFGEAKDARLSLAAKPQVRAGWPCSRSRSRTAPGARRGHGGDDQPA